MTCWCGLRCKPTCWPPWNLMMFFYDSNVKIVEFRMFLANEWTFYTCKKRTNMLVWFFGQHVVRFAPAFIVTECLIEQIAKELKSYCSRFTLNILMALEKTMLFRYDSLYSVLLLQFITFTSLLFNLLGVGSYRIYRILGSLADIKLILHFLYTSWNKHQTYLWFLFSTFNTATFLLARF